MSPDSRAVLDIMSTVMMLGGASGLTICGLSWWRSRQALRKLDEPGRHYKVKASQLNPLGVDTPGEMFHDAMRQMISDEVAFNLRGRSSKDFDHVPAPHLAMELIARGWVCYKPAEDLKKS